MRIRLQNIAKIYEAIVECHGLTAIIGDNDRGKSTIGKVLYSMFHTLRHLDVGMFNAQASYVLKSAKLPNSAMTRRFFKKADFDIDVLCDEKEMSRRVELNFWRLVGQPYSVATWRSDLFARKDVDVRRVTEDILRGVDLVRHFSSKELLHDAVTNDLNRYFSNQFLPNFKGIYPQSLIEVSLSDGYIAARWNANEEEAMKTDVQPTNDVWFIGSPLIIDTLGQMDRRRVFSSNEIENELIARLRRYRPAEGLSRRIADLELEPVYRLLEKHLPGAFSYGENGMLGITSPGMDQPLNVANLSMGMKMLALLRLMIEANLLTRRDVLVLDEPENHLHPELQVVFAEAIVLLQRIYDLRVIITTHSPYFLQALELASRRIKAENRGEGELLKVYQPEPVDDLGRVTFADMSNKISEMYRKFAITMRNLDNERRLVDELERPIREH